MTREVRLVGSRRSHTILGAGPDLLCVGLLTQSPIAKLFAPRIKEEEEEGAFTLSPLAII